MSKPTEIVWLAVVASITAAVAAPALSRLAAGLAPLVVVIGVLVIVARVVWFYTR